MLMDSSVIITAVQPEFIVTFNVTKEAGSYNSFIQKLRRRLASGRYAGTVPMLNPEQDGRNKWFHIVLISGNSQITVRFRLGDLYLVAFQGANDTWYEFKPEEGHDKLFSDTLELSYTWDYPNDNDSFRRNTTVGANALASAISSLADPNFNREEMNNHQFLINLMIMIPEALRFRTVSDFVYARMHDPNIPDSPITLRIAELVKDWGTLSMQMRRSDLFASFAELVDLGIRSACWKF